MSGRSWMGRGIALGWIGVGALACSGWLGPDDAAQQAQKDAEDPAQKALSARDYAGAEGILQERLKKDPNDARSRRLLGDVNLVRGQHYKERWKENLGWAVEAYAAAVAADPGNCVSWGRLGAVVLAAAENPATQVPRATLDALPLDSGRAACPGAALLAIEASRRPSDSELDGVARRIDADPRGPEVLAVAAPWIAEAVRRVDLSSVDWGNAISRPPLGPGVPFVVTNVPASTGSIDGSEPRRFTSVEWLSPKSVGGDRIVFVDRRFPKTVPATAVTMAPGCPGTTWKLQGTDRIPTGTCTGGPQDRRASELYDPRVLRVAGAAHFHQPSIAAAKIAWETVAEKSVSCVAGPVGRMFVDTPSCQVTYDQAIPQTRSIAKSAGLTAWTVEHAETMVFAGRSGKLLGEDVAAHLARGEVAVGLPYSLFVFSQPELPGCKGRGLLQKLEIVDGALQFACTIKGLEYRFRELTLTEVRRAADGQ